MCVVVREEKLVHDTEKVLQKLDVLPSKLLREETTSLVEIHLYEIHFAMLLGQKVTRSPSRSTFGLPK